MISKVNIIETKAANNLEKGYRSEYLACLCKMASANLLDDGLLAINTYFNNKGNINSKAKFTIGGSSFIKKYS